MQRRRSTRPTSLAVLLAAVAGVTLSACAGSKFETDDDGAAATASTTSTPTPSSAESNSDSNEGAVPPSLPPVEPPVSLEPPRPPAPVTPAPETSESSAETSTAPAEGSAGDGNESSAGATSADPTGPEPSSDDTSAPDTPGDPSADVPDTEHCAPVADWDPAWAQWEQEVLLLVNENRAAGANCDTEGEFGPAEPLTMEPMLRCSARLHSMDMFERDFFDHTNPDGLDPFDRMAEAGFEGSYMGENIAYGQASPEQVMADWMESDGHCSNIMNPNFTLIGVGYHEGADNPRDGKHFWTQNFGTPFMEGGGFGGRFGGAATN